MPRRLAVCPACQTPLPDTALNTGRLESCPACGTPSQVEVFPALFRAKAIGSAGELIIVPGEAGCFYHPDKKAAVPCAECGRFLCALCDLELNGRHLCPACLETGQRQGRLAELEKHRTLYDSAALTLAVLPVLFWPVTIFTAPTVLYLVVHGWRQPGSLLRRSRWRFVVAALLALAEIGGWVTLFYFMIAGPTRS